MLKEQTKAAIKRRGYGIDGARIGNYVYEIRAMWDRELWRSYRGWGDWEYVGVLRNDFTVDETARRTMPGEIEV